MEDTQNLTVRFKNELNLVPLKKFNAKQMNLFFALCARMKDRGLQNVTFSFEELKDLSEYKMTATSAFIKDLEKMYENMLKLSYKKKSEDIIQYFVLFTGFQIDTKKRLVGLSVNPELEYVINDLTTEFTKFELSTFTALRSIYAKNLFRLLIQYRSTGYYVTSIEKFRELMDIPQSYRQMGQIDQKVLKPALKELSQYFNKLTVKKVKTKGNKITKLEFNFSGMSSDLPRVSLVNWLDGE